MQNSRTRRRAALLRNYEIETKGSKTKKKDGTLFPQSSYENSTTIAVSFFVSGSICLPPSNE